ncbi:MAG: methyltransferase domain-containing protein [Candidatus Magnetominusculus sp. LBB02]|nr:methyltransferase domain-containing protein [Candidatus Magnetominusculus sp. LBB02]
MIIEIENIKNRHKFDFLQYACPDDEMSYLFDEWVDYYHEKFAICKFINPKNILEVGFRYGYSAIAFLSATAEAAYVGIDDKANQKAARESLQWAKKITTGFHAEFLMADSGKVETLPGEFYDLINIYGQEDADRTFALLELALEKGHWILLDGLFQLVISPVESRENYNLLCASLFLNKYRTLIEYAFIMPGNAGLLLIKTKNTRQRQALKTTHTSAQGLKEYYTMQYYLTDCGGYKSFKASGGKQLDDMRLQIVYNLAEPLSGKKVLDVGCGRGELAFACSQAGAAATGLDYSKSAVDIANNYYSKRHNLRFICQDIFELTEEKQLFDIVFATDVIEHIPENDFEGFLKIIRTLLSTSGKFIVHTSPNKLMYQRFYEKKRQMAKEIGTYLPANPRSYYEDLVHVNEQTPEALRHSLQRVFPHVLVWSASLPDAVGSLAANLSHEQLTRHESIFAVASFEPVKKDDVIAAVSQYRMNLQKLNTATDTFIRHIAELHRGKRPISEAVTQTGALIARVAWHTLRTIYSKVAKR